jgi:hypothetical protein
MGHDAGVDFVTEDWELNSDKCDERVKISLLFLDAGRIVEKEG